MMGNAVTSVCHEVDKTAFGHNERAQFAVGNVGKLLRPRLFTSAVTRAAAWDIFMKRSPCRRCGGKGRNEQE